MFTRRLVIPALIALLVCAGTSAVSWAATLHGGTLGSASPEYITPASADLFISIDRGDTQGPALAQLWQTYRTHPGTAAALAHLGADINQQGRVLQTLNPMLAPFGDRAAVALWAPASAPLTSGSRPSIAVIAQLKMPNLLGGTRPLAGLASLTPLSTYRGIQVYAVHFSNGNGLGYGCVVSGDGVLTSNMATMMKVIDTALYAAPSLATDPNYANAVASLPAPRLLTVYIGPHFLALALRSSSLLGLPRRSVQFGPTVPASLMRAGALAVTAAPDGVGVTTSVIPEPANALNVDPNAAASVVASNAVLYTSQDDIAGTLEAAGLLSGKTGKALARLEAQSGINVRRDLLSWMNGEVALNLNTSVSPVVSLLAATQSGGFNPSTVLKPPALPGSLEVAWHVDNPDSVQQSLDRVFTALAQKLSASSTSSLPITIKFKTTTLPNGAQVHALSTVPSLGYAFRGNWLLLSSNIMNDAASMASLTTNTDYSAALARVSGSGPLINVSYLDISRLLAVVDKWIGFIAAQRHTSSGSSAPLHGHTGTDIAPLHEQISMSDVQASDRLFKTAMPLLHRVMSLAVALDNRVQRSILKQSAPNLTWRQVEPLIAPLHNVISVTRLVGTSDGQLQAFLTIR